MGRVFEYESCSWTVFTVSSLLVPFPTVSRGSWGQGGLQSHKTRGKCFDCVRVLCAGVCLRAVIFIFFFVLRECVCVWVRIDAWQVNEQGTCSRHQAEQLKISPQRYNWYLSASLSLSVIVSLSLSLSLIIPCSGSPPEGRRDCQRWVSFSPPCLHLCHCPLLPLPAVLPRPPSASRG